jgi:hypothetical protein
MVINMGKYTVYAYDAEIELGGETYSVLLGIEEEGHPSHAYEDSWCDNKIYYYMTDAELAELKSGDELDEGTVLVSIDKNNPTIYEVEYA